jgi:hypothetical protein
MNQLVKLALQNKTFKERLREPGAAHPNEDKILVTFLNKKEAKEQEEENLFPDDDMAKQFMEWLGNQRWPELDDEGGGED